MHNFKKSKVWEKCMDLAVSIYEQTKVFPDDERFGLTAQMRRAAVSIPSNIAEGSNRNTDKDFSRFLSISLGSSAELETQLLLSKRLNFLGEEYFNLMLSELEEGQKILNVLINKYK